MTQQLKQALKTAAQLAYLHAGHLTCIVATPTAVREGRQLARLILHIDRYVARWPLPKEAA